MEKVHGASELTPEVAEVIYDGIRSGLPNSLAYERANVQHRCFYKWIEKGTKHIEEDRETNYSIFVHTLKQVRSQTSKNWLDAINDGCKSWQAKAWLLERCQAKHFSQHAQEIANMQEQMAEIKGLLSKVLAPAEIKNEDE
jgi:hypothetical protein